MMFVTSLARCSCTRSYFWALCAILGPVCHPGLSAQNLIAVVCFVVFLSWGPAGEQFTQQATKAVNFFVPVIVPKFLFCIHVRSEIDYDLSAECFFGQHSQKHLSVE